MDLATFFANYGIIILLFVLLIFMFWSSRRRQQKQKLEQEAKARQTVPGAEVLLQGGLYGTIVSYDADNLDQPAVVEIAPGVDIKVHSQAILRIVNPGEDVADEEFDTTIDELDTAADEAAAVESETVAEVDTDSDTEPGAKPQA